MLKVTGIPAFDCPSGTVTSADTVACLPIVPCTDGVVSLIAVGITAEIPLNLPSSSSLKDTTYSLSAV